MSLKNELITIAHNGNGSFKTRSDRETIVTRFSDRLQNELNIQVRTVEQIKVKYVEAYIALRLTEGISQRTLQNEMSALRSVLTASGRNEFVSQERLSNKSLGLAGASREGTKTAIKADKFQSVIAAAIGRDKGVAACIQLCRQIGLRSEESVQASKSLTTWARNISEAKSIRVIFGTKTGRPRDVAILPSQRDKIVEAIKFASRVASENGGKLIDKPNLKSAMDRFHNEARAVGLVGANAPHSLRYAFARDQLQAYLSNGYTYKESLALVSCDLGHGDGRGDYVKHVYLK